MKKILKIGFIVFVFIQSVSLSAQTFKSKYGNDFVQYAQITIEQSGAIVYYSRKSIEGNENIKQQIFNLTDLDFEKHIFDIKEDGKYWYIPFAEDPPFMINGGCRETHCEAHYTCSAGECDWHNDVCDCGHGSSNPCHVIMCPGNDGGVYIGPGVFVYAERVIGKD